MDAVQVIAEPRRREILRLVWDGERSASEIAARANRAALGPLAGMLEQMWADRLDRLAELAESEDRSS